MDDAQRSENGLDHFLMSIGNTPDGVYAVDEGHRIILWNDAAHRILGFSCEEVLGRLCYEVVAGRDAEGHIVCQGGCADIALAKAGQLIPSREMVTRTKDGKEVSVDVTNIPIPSEFGGLSTVVHIFRKASPQKQIEHLVDRLSSLMVDLTAHQSPEEVRDHDDLKPHQPLTAREREVLGLLTEGADSASIAKALAISRPTARKHIQNIIRKLNVHTTLEAVAYSFKHNLLAPSYARRPPVS